MNRIGFKPIDWYNIPFFIETLKKEPLLGYRETDDLTAMHIYQIELEDEFVGFFGLERRQNMLCFCFFYVKPEHRNKGIGTSVINKLCYEFRKERIYGFVATSNHQAINIYNKKCVWLNKERNGYFMTDTMLYIHQKASIDKETFQLDAYEFLFLTDKVKKDYGYKN